MIPETLRIGHFDPKKQGMDPTRPAGSVPELLHRDLTTKCRFLRLDFFLRAVKKPQNCGLGLIGFRESERYVHKSF